MNRVDLFNIEEFTNVAIGQMEMCNDILTGGGSHPFLQVLPSGESMALATHISMADAMLKALALLVGSILLHTPEEERRTDGKCVHPCPNSFWVKGKGRLDSGEGHYRCTDPLHWVENQDDDITLSDHQERMSERRQMGLTDF